LAGSIRTLTIEWPSALQLANGQRFLVAVRAPDPNAPPINIVVNWRALLNR
jgi:hypothetical protein